MSVLRALLAAGLLIASVASARADVRADSSALDMRAYIPRLIVAQYCTPAVETADRWVAEAETRHGSASAEAWDARLLQAEAHVQCRIDRAEIAMRLDTLERALPPELTTPIRRATLERLRGMTLMSENRWEMSTTHLDRALALLAAAGAEESRDFAMTSFYKARAVRMQGWQGEALRLFDRACEILERLYGPNDLDLLHALEYLALSERYAQDPAGALAIFDRVVPELERQLGSHAPHMVLTYYRQAIAYAQIGKFDTAKRLCRKGIEIAAFNPEESASSLVGPYYWLAEVALQERDEVLADSLATMALESAARLPERQDLGSAGMSLRGVRTHARYRLGRIEDAEREWAAVSALNSSKGAWSRADSSEDLGLRGRFALARGETERASALLERGAEIDREVRLENKGAVAAWDTGFLEPSVALCDWLSGRVERAFDLALRVERNSREELRQTARTLSDEDALRLEARRNDGLGLALTALRGGGLGDSAVARAFDAVVRSRAVVLDAVTARHAITRTSSNPRAAALAESLEVLERRASSLAMRQDVMLDAELEAIASLRRTWTAQLAAHDPVGARVDEGAGVGASEIHAALPERGSLVSYVRFAGHEEPAGSRVDDLGTTARYLAFVIQGGSASIRAVDLGPAESLDAQIERWRSLVAAGDGARAVGDSLRRAIWDPVSQASASASSVFIVPDGAIALVPIQALPDVDGGFVLEHSGPIRSLSAERDLGARRGTIVGSGALVFGDPDFARVADVDRLVADSGRPTFRGATSDCEEFRDLMFTRITQSGAEAREVAALARGGRIPCTVLVDERASEESFKRLAPGRRFLHVASHGFALSDRCRKLRDANETSLVRAGIALAGANARAELPAAADREDGILTAEEVAVLDLTGAECVVLSACESGVGEVVTGEGVLGMRRAFHQAGAASLVSSLWKVEDAATRAWMREFYRGLFGAHPDPAEAARAASLAVIQRARKSGKEPTPALWGAFVVCGVPATR